jgi:hypothetical protein
VEQEGAARGALLGRPWRRRLRDARPRHRAREGRARDESECSASPLDEATRRRSEG